jgi:hypothetical protein
MLIEVLRYVHGVSTEELRELAYILALGENQVRVQGAGANRAAPGQDRQRCRPETELPAGRPPCDHPHPAATSMKRAA